MTVTPVMVSILEEDATADEEDMVEGVTVQDGSTERKLAHEKCLIPAP